MARSDSARRPASWSRAATTAPASTSSRHTAVPMPPPPAPATTTLRPVKPRRSSSIAAPLPKRMLGAHRYHAGMLTGRVVLVTGGGAGIGRAIARGLEDARATVAVVEGDFASLSATEAAFAAARDAAGPLDALVHAFVDPDALTSDALAETAAADWDRRCEALLRAALHCCQAAGQELAERGGR